MSVAKPPASRPRLEVAIVATGVANIASVAGAFERLGGAPRLVDSPDEISKAAHLVLPGVGSLGAGMAALGRLGLVDPLRERLREGRPTLAICLGLQLLARRSEETPGIEGLGIIDAEVTRLRGPRSPHMGWNALTPDPSCVRLSAGSAFFANTFALPAPPLGWSAASCRYGAPFVAAMERGDLLACQFHPELSGPWGLALLQRWLAGAKSAPSAGAAAGGMSPGLNRRIIPCLDVRDGRVVKGVRFAGLRDAGDPAQLAGEYARQGADEIVMLDVSATLEVRSTMLETIRAIRRRIGVPLTVGGGVRSEADARAALQAGADKVSVNTAAVERPELLAELSTQFGRQCTVLAIDARADPEAGGWRVVTHAGRQVRPLDVVAWARRAEALGAGEILLTSFDRDGVRSGYDLALLRAVCSAVSIPVIASGGADSADHMSEAFSAGAEAALAASIFHDGDTTVAQVKRRLADLHVPVRLDQADAPHAETVP